jgi:hypothetical protein
MGQFSMGEILGVKSLDFCTKELLGVPHPTKSSLNPGSEGPSRKYGPLFAFVLLCSMGWGSTNVFQPENIG